jgi:CubicO group peptidase (beta-lactamase class C family)
VIQRSSGGGGPPTPIENATAKLAPPGLAAAVVSTDGAAEIVTSGLADVRTLRPVTAHTTFLWFSMTKIVTATAVMMLADRGALDLDAPVTGHVPGLRVLRGPGSAITASPAVALFRAGEPPAGSLGAASGGTATRRRGVPRPPAAPAPAAGTSPATRWRTWPGRFPSARG